MGTHHCKRILATLGMLLFFVLGSFAVSLAHDAPSAGSLPVKAVHGRLKHGPAQVDRYTLSIGMDAETGDLPNYSQPVLQEFKLAYLSRFGPINALALIQPQAIKVPLQILDLALLI
jgi:hypothetical protein